MLISHNILYLTNTSQYVTSLKHTDYIPKIPHISRTRFFWICGFHRHLNDIAESNNTFLCNFG